MKAALPDSLLGIFYMDDATKPGATDLHQRFLAHFKLKPSAFPLLHFSLTEGFRAG